MNKSRQARTFSDIFLGPLLFMKAGLLITVVRSTPIGIATEEPVYQAAEFDVKSSGSTGRPGTMTEKQEHDESFTAA